jgi:DNA invertase Pin-like site-specific DNA recombinase
VHDLPALSVRFDVVCVWRFDRFARSVSHLLRALETFKALGIDFCFILRTNGHFDACREDGFHCFGCCRRA